MYTTIAVVSRKNRCFPPQACPSKMKGQQLCFDRLTWNWQRAQAGLDSMRCFLRAEQMVKEKKCRNTLWCPAKQKSQHQYISHFSREVVRDVNKQYHKHYHSSGWVQRFNTKYIRSQHVDSTWILASSMDPLTPDCIDWIPYLHLATDIWGCINPKYTLIVLVIWRNWTDPVQRENSFSAQL